MFLPLRLNIRFPIFPKAEYDWIIVLAKTDCDLDYLILAGLRPSNILRINYETIIFMIKYIYI